MGVGWGVPKKNDRPLSLWSKSMNLLVVFDLDLKKCFALRGVCMGGVGQAVVQPMQWLVFFAMSAVLATSESPCYLP